MPQEIKFQQGETSYLYDASGVKLRVKHKTANSSVNIPQFGGVFITPSYKVVVFNDIIRYFKLIATMSTGYKIDEKDGIYYLTFQIVEWVDIFTRQIYRDIIIDSFRFCQKNKGLEIYAYVLMSNHIHLLIRGNGGNLSNTIKEIKSFTAKKILESINGEQESRRDWMLDIFEFSAKQHKRNEKYQIWTHENDAEIVYSNQFMEQKINYIH